MKYTTVPEVQYSPERTVEKSSLTWTDGITTCSVFCFLQCTQLAQESPVIVSSYSLVSLCKYSRLRPFIPDAIRQPRASSAPTCRLMRQPIYSWLPVKGQINNVLRHPSLSVSGPLKQLELLLHPFRVGVNFDEWLILPHRADAINETTARGPVAFDSNNYSSSLTVGKPLE